MLFSPYLFVTLYIVQLLIWCMLILSISFLKLLFSYLHNPNFWLHKHFCQLCNVYCQLCSIYCCWHYPVSCVTHTVGSKTHNVQRENNADAAEPQTELGNMSACFVNPKYPSTLPNLPISIPILRHMDTWTLQTDRWKGYPLIICHTKSP